MSGQQRCTDGLTVTDTQEGRSANGGAPVLAVRNLVKEYPGTVALKGVTIELHAREVLGLIGENGAGKSTLLKILTGVEAPTSGEVFVNGEPVRLRGVRDATTKGIGMVFQEQSLIPNLTIAENLFLGREDALTTAGVIRRARRRRLALEALEPVGVDLDPDTVVEDLSFVQRQMVEIAKALLIGQSSGHAPVLLLDEPTSVLEGEDLERLFALIDKLRDDIAIVFISHRLDEVLRVSDRVYILRDGEVVAERHPDDTVEHDLHLLMVGADHNDDYFVSERQRREFGPLRLRIDDLVAEGIKEPLSFGIYGGEVVALVGTEGSGIEAVARSVVGIVDRSSGTIAIDGETAAIRRPSDSAGLGVGYIPSERKTDGALLSLSVRENLTLAYLDEFATRSVISRRRERAATNEWIDRLRVKTPGTDVPMRSLSGGNQQKVVLAKWLLSERLRVLVVETPTRGLDVGAKADVYDVIRDAADRGVAVMLLADTLEEAIGLANRVIVLRDGRQTGEVAAPADDKPLPVGLIEWMV